MDFLAGADSVVVFVGIMLQNLSGGGFGLGFYPQRSRYFVVKLMFILDIASTTE